MGKRGKNIQAAKFHYEEEENEELTLKPTISPIVLISSDDEEANEDLSLKIVEKSLLRVCKRSDSVSDDPKTGGGTDLSLLPSQGAEVVETDVKSKKKNMKQKKNKQVEKPEKTAVVAKEEDKAETSKSMDITEIVETNPIEISDNIVLRKLLRGPRYFDPPDNGWGTCYNCGEEGHTTVNCTSARRKKPCFVCGSLEHHAKQCTKGQDCFICKKGGHRAKNCPEKYKVGPQNFKICLICGDSGHDMFSCKNDYSPEDLKEIKCYICKSFGHLCCSDFTYTTPSELSCYRCGQLGHCGLECIRSRGETTNAGLLTSCFKCGDEGHFARECTSSKKECIRSRGETTNAGLLTSCFKCGDEGHFARECTSSKKIHKRNNELSTPRQKVSKENQEYGRVRSVPSYIGKAHKRKKVQYEGEFGTPATSKRRGGWITEDPGDLPCGKVKIGGWGTPMTPTNNKWNKTYSSGAGGYTPNSRSPRNTQNLHFGASASNGSSKFYQHRYSASRFGNSSSDGMWRNYGW